MRGYRRPFLWAAAAAVLAEGVAPAVAEEPVVALRYIGIHSIYCAKCPAILPLFVFLPRMGAVRAVVYYSAVIERRPKPDNHLSKQHPGRIDHPENPGLDGRRGAMPIVDLSKSSMRDGDGFKELCGDSPQTAFGEYILRQRGTS